MSSIALLSLKNVFSQGVEEAQCLGNQEVTSDMAANLATATKDVSIYYLSLITITGIGIACTLYQITLCLRKAVHDLNAEETQLNLQLKIQGKTVDYQSFIYIMEYLSLYNRCNISLACKSFYEIVVKLNKEELSNITKIANVRLCGFFNSKEWKEKIKRLRVANWLTDGQKTIRDDFPKAVQDLFFADIKELYYMEELARAQDTLTVWKEIASEAKACLIFPDLTDEKSVIEKASGFSQWVETNANTLNFPKLNLSKKGLTSIPKEIGRFTRLKELDLSENQLISLPKEIGRFTQLEELNVSKNQLTSLPEAISNLTQLIKLKLCDNPLASFPEGISRFTQPIELLLDENQLTSFPKEIDNLNLTQPTNLPRGMWLAQINNSHFDVIRFRNASVRRNSRAF